MYTPMRKKNVIAATVPIVDIGAGMGPCSLTSEECVTLTFVTNARTSDVINVDDLILIRLWLHQP